MAGRWNDRASDYPPILITFLWAVKSEAVRWIDENLPLHSARPMFMGELDEPAPKAPGGGAGPKGKLLAADR